MGKLTTILKRELRHLMRLAIAFFGLIIMLMASVVTFPIYLCSRLSRKN